MKSTFGTFILGVSAIICVGMLCLTIVYTRDSMLKIETVKAISSMGERKECIEL